VNGWIGQEEGAEGSRGREDKVKSERLKGEEGNFKVQNPKFK